MRETKYRKPQAVVSAGLALLLAAGVWQAAGANGRDDDRSPNNRNCRSYSIDVTTGQAFSLGQFDEAVVDIAIPLNQR